MQSPIEETKPSIEVVPGTTIQIERRTFVAVFVLVISMLIAFVVFTVYTYRDVRGFVQESHTLADPVNSRVIITHLYVLDIFGNELVHFAKVDDMLDGYVTGEKHCLSPLIRCDHFVDDVTPSIYP